LSVMDGSFLVVVGYSSPSDSEHDFPAQLKGICTPASALLPEKGGPGTSGVPGGSGGSRQAGAIALGTALAWLTLPHVAWLEALVGWLAVPRKRGLRIRRPRVEKELRARFGAVTPGRTCPARSCGSVTGFS
jgi:hypothetical protein